MQGKPDSEGSSNDGDATIPVAPPNDSAEPKQLPAPVDAPFPPLAPGSPTLPAPTTSTSPQVDPQVNPPTSLEGEFIAERRDFATTFKRTFLILLIIIAIYVIAIQVVLATNLVASDTIDRMGLGGAMQVSLAMIFGFVCIFFGMQMTWLSIQADYSMRGNFSTETASGGVKLVAASPGLIFFIGGVAVIICALFKPLKFELKPATTDAVEIEALGMDPPPPLKKVPK